MQDKFLQEPVKEFVSFCIENFKIKYNKSEKEVVDLFNESGVMEFIIEGYDVLHTQYRDYIIEEIEIFLENRKVNI